MNLVSYLESLASRPGFGGWLRPVGNNPTLTITLSNGTQVVADVLNTAPAGDKNLRVYARRIAGTNCDAVVRKVYVADYGTPQEAAYSQSAQAPPTPQNRLTMSDLSSKLGLVKAMTLFAKISAAASNPNPIVAAIVANFSPLLNVGSAGLDFYAPATVEGINLLKSAGVFTEQDAADLLGQTVIPEEF